MKKAVLYTHYYQYQNNKIFDLNDVFTNRDNCFYSFFLLKESLATLNFSLATQDINKISEAQFVIYNDFPIDLRDKSALLKQNAFLFIWESELIQPDNWVRENHKCFRKIFTWNDQWVDGHKYIKYYWPNKIPANLEFDINTKSKLCTLVAGNKMVKHPLELYSERINAIRWFERYHPEDFDLYGMGWDKYVFKTRLIRRLNTIKPLTKMLAKKYPSYKGTIETKSETLKGYKFAICYENAKEIPGYITEKIFDCFFAGCVPVYWGAPNVTDFIPADTFIDKRNFKGYEELYKYLKTMPAAEYERYLAAIEHFIKSDAMYLFSAEYFADLVTAEITGGL
jgi:hypothetical protein